jgi:uroporphyrin-III C-methyltransferase
LEETEAEKERKNRGTGVETMTPLSGGKVFLVGAGPGDPELLTVKAYALLQRADVVLHDDLVPAAIVSLAGKSALVVNVGKRCGAKGISQAEINFLMIEHARLGKSVVRLKSGDPAIFGRLAEETDALAGANVEYEIIPGITSALAAAGSLGISLTDRRKSSRIVIASGHRARGGAGEPRARNDWSGLAHEDTTLIVYMPGRNLTELRNELLEAGLAADTPAAIISRVSTPRQREWLTTLGKLNSLPAVEAPSLLMIGRTLERTRPGTAAENRARIFEGVEGESVLTLVESDIAPESSEIHLKRGVAS